MTYDEFDRLRNLPHSDLMRRLDERIAQMDQGPDADVQCALLLDLRAYIVAGCKLAEAQTACLDAMRILAASLVHDLAQPLSAASFFSGTALSLLKQGVNDPDKLFKILSGVEGQIQRAADTLQRLREFLQRRELHLAVVAIDEVVARAMDLVGRFAADKDVRVRFVQPAASLAIAADALQIERVLVNLVCNGIRAIDAAQMASREVSIAVDRRPGEIEVTVYNTGPEIPPGAYASLFDIFAAIQGAGPGMGMGLAISRDIVETHGGRLWADPDLTGGAAFHFTLPLAQPGDPE